MTVHVPHKSTPDLMVLDAQDSIQVTSNADERDKKDHIVHASDHMVMDNFESVSTLRLVTNSKKLVELSVFQFSKVTATIYPKKQVTSDFSIPLDEISI